MGIEKTLKPRTFPYQSCDVGRVVEVTTIYDPSCTLKGKIVRFDVEEPRLVIIELENREYISSTECHTAKIYR